MRGCAGTSRRRAGGQELPESVEIIVEVGFPEKSTHVLGVEASERRDCSPFAQMGHLAVTSASHGLFKGAKEVGEEEGLPPWTAPARRCCFLSQRTWQEWLLKMADADIADERGWSIDPEARQCMSDVSSM